MLIIAVPSKGDGGLNNFLNKRFGRCDSITIISIEDDIIKAVKAIPIYATETIGNLGIYVAEIVRKNRASDVIIRYIGPKAFQSLNSQNIKIYQSPDEDLSVKECIDLFIQGKLTMIKESNSHLINK